jgi:hypothetical protein
MISMPSGMGLLAPLAAAAPELLIASGVISAGAAVYGGLAAQQQGQYAAKVATANASEQQNIYNYNAGVDNINADRTMEDAGNQVTVLQRQAASVMGTDTADIGASGGSVEGSATFGDVMMEQVMLEQQQKGFIYQSAMAQSASYQNQGSLAVSQGQQAIAVGQQQASISELSGNNQFAGSLLAGTGDVASGFGRAAALKIGGQAQAVGYGS